MHLSDELTAALEAARAAGEIARSFYRRDFEVRSKPDRSPVTEADVRCEEAIRGILKARFPEYGFFGEESGSSALDADNVWLVDPIDGTKAFVRGYPMFSTQIALMRHSKLRLGVSNAPVYGEFAYAERGRGASLNGSPLRVSTTAQLADAALSAGNIATLAAGERWNRYGALVARVARIRGYGDFLHYHLLAAGHIDAVVESDVNILDIAACAVIVEEAGGCCTELGGAPLTLASTDILATNGRLHGAMLDALGM